MSGPETHDLIGYILGALGRKERQEVERRLRTDKLLRAKLNQLRRRLGRIPLHLIEEDPPVGLAERTIRLISQKGSIISSCAARSDEAAGAGPGLPARRSSHEHGAADTVLPRVPEWIGWGNAIVAFVVLTVFIASVISAVAAGRQLARSIDCRDRVRQFASGLFTATSFHTPRSDWLSVASEVVAQNDPAQLLATVFPFDPRWVGLESCPVTWRDVSVASEPVGVAMALDGNCCGDVVGHICTINFCSGGSTQPDPMTIDQRLLVGPLCIGEQTLTRQTHLGGNPSLFCPVITADGRVLSATSSTSVPVVLTVAR